MSQDPVIFLPLSPGLFALAACLLVSSCTPTQTPQVNTAAYNPLDTPPHRMSKRDYPFDERGRYRKDWVKSGTGRNSSSSTVASSAPSQSYSSRSTASVPVRRTSTTSSASPSRTTSSSPPASKPTYHKVVKGDTLYSISRRYGLSLSDLKRKNGLTGDLIRTGQSLRIR